MLPRLLSFYLWIAPLMFAPLWLIYHRVGLGAGIAGGVVHLLLTAGGMWAQGMFRRTELPTAYGLTRFLLTTGGAIVWMLGPSGPPRRHDGIMSFYNNGGLLAGAFVVLLGLTALKTDLQKHEKGALAAVGQAAIAAWFGIWVIESFQIWVILSAPAVGLPVAQRPDWLVAEQIVWENIDILRMITAYVGGAAFVSAVMLTGRIVRWAGWLMLAFSIAGIVSGITQTMPFFIPAVTCLVPYYLGLAVRRSGQERSS